MSKLRFAGHESFAVKGAWLRKGYKFVHDGGNFNDPDAVVNLGVGKNMVNAIRHWMRAFGLIDDQNQLTDLANYFFNKETGRDHYLEDVGSSWLLHHSLVVTGYASIYNLVFNEFLPRRNEFTIDTVTNWVESKLKTTGESHNQGTIHRDASVLLRTYLNLHKVAKEDPEDEFAKPLVELGLIGRGAKLELRGQVGEVFHFERATRPNLPWQIVACALLDQLDGRHVISLNDALDSPNSAGLVFGLSRSGLLEKVEEMQDEDIFHKPVAIFSGTAGNEVIQIQEGLSKQSILSLYYAE